MTAKTGTQRKAMVDTTVIELSKPCVIRKSSESYLESYCKIFRGLELEARGSNRWRRSEHWRYSILIANPPFSCFQFTGTKTMMCNHTLKGGNDENPWLDEIKNLNLVNFAAPDQKANRFCFSCLINLAQGKWRGGRAFYIV